MADVASPWRMCAAIVEVLGVSGAGLIMSQQLSPVGANDDDARRAEQVQATLNEGPCLTSAAQGRVLLANEVDLEQHWPMYYRELRIRTRYRATLSFPITAVSGDAHGAPFAALNLYSDSPVWRLEEELPVDSAEIVDLVGVMLLLTRLPQRSSRGGLAGLR